MMTLLLTTGPSRSPEKHVWHVHLHKIL